MFRVLLLINLIYLIQFVVVLPLGKNGGYSLGFDSNVCTTLLLTYFSFLLTNDSVSFVYSEIVP